MTCDVLMNPSGLAIYKGKKSGYNMIFPMEEKEIMNTEFDTAKRLFKGCRRTVRRAVETQISLYAPLEFKPTFKRLIKTLQADDFKVLREIPDDVEPEIFLDEWMRISLIKNASMRWKGSTSGGF